jgi:hypothetical protein
MNRHQRRRAAKMARENAFYNDHIRHLPKVALDAPYEAGQVYHLVHFHDSWCAIYDVGRACNCQPIITRHVEPSRT